MTTDQVPPTPPTVTSTEASAIATLTPASATASDAFSGASATQDTGVLTFELRRVLAAPHDAPAANFPRERIAIREGAPTELRRHAIEGPNRGNFSNSQSHATFTVTRGPDDAAHTCSLTAHKNAFGYGVGLNGSGVVDEVRLEFSSTALFPQFFFPPAGAGAGR